MNKFLLTVLVSSISIWSFAQNFSPKKIQKHINYLASDNLEGRGTGSAGEKKAAEYIIKNFKKSKISPKGENGGYIQIFPAKKGLPPTIQQVQAANVIGFIDNNAENTIIIGAHYDHLGKGDQGSSLLANSVGMIHNGADDNASGTAAIIELANYFSKNNKTEKHNFLFIGFSGEELGLMGSKFFCDNPTIDLKKVTCMINMDMVGRYREDKGVAIGGYGTSSFWGKEIPSLASNIGLKYTVDSTGVGPSDHTSFYLKDLPVMFLFTGGHQEYHKPTDDANLINAEGEAKLLELIVSVVEKLDEVQNINFLKTSNPHSRSTASSFKVTMGIMPDYSYDKGGVKIDGVTEGRPAHKAGILQNDILLKIGEYEIKDITDYMKALGKFEKGQAVEAVIKRKDETIKVDVTF